MFNKGILIESDKYKDHAGEEPLVAITFKLPNFYLSLLTTLLGFSITWFILGMYYVEYESMVSGFLSGKLTPGVPFRSLHFIGHIGTSYLYSYLYQIAPNVEWLSYISCAYLLISTFIGLYLIASLLPNKMPLSVKGIFQLIVFFLVFSDQYIHFIYTRTSYMMCGLSLLGLIFMFNSPSVIKSRLGLFIFLNLFFTIGALTRIESATACVLLMCAFGVFYFHSIKHFILVFAYPLVLIIAITVGIACFIKTSHEYYIQVEPDIEAQFTERKNIEPVSYMKTYHDSVLYKAASNFMWSDPKVFTPQYLRSLIMPEKFMFMDGRQWHRVYNDITSISIKYWYLVAISLLLTLMIFFQYNFGDIALGRLRLLLFELSFWALLCIQTYTVKVNDRSFSPFISLFILCHLLLLIQHAVFIKQQVYSVLFWVAVLFTTQLYYLKSASNKLLSYTADYQRNADKIKEVAKGKYLVINSSSADYLFLSNVPFRPYNFSAFKNIYIVDGYIMPFIPYYRHYLENECHCDLYEYPSFLHYLSSIHQQVVIVSDADRLNLTNAYLHEMYNDSLSVKQLQFIHLNKVEKTDEHGRLPDLQVYTLTK